MKLQLSDVCRCILKVLADTDGHPLGEDVLQEHVNARLRPVPPQATFDDAMVAVKSAGHVKALEGDFGGPARWLLSEKGEAWLASRP